jgi:Zn-dependent metalloprotease
MKNFNLWFILSLIAIFAMTCASQWNITHEDTAQSNTLYTDEPTEHDTIKLADIVSYTDRDGVMYFDTNKTKHLHGFTGDSIMFYYGYLFDVGEHNELRFERKSLYRQTREVTTYFYSLYHKGYFCKRVAANFGEKGKQIFEGSFSKFDFDIDTSISVTKEKAILIAKAAIPEKEYAWEKEGWEAFANAPNPILTIHEVANNEYRLTYTFSLTVFPFKIYDFIIDAQTGEILRKRDASNYCNACQNCNNEVTHNNVTPLYYNNLLESVWIKQCSTATGQCNKLEQTNHHRIIMFDHLDYNMPPQEVCWETGNSLPHNSLLSAYWATETTYEYFSSNFNYHGYDGTNTGRTVVKMVGHPTISGASNFFNPASTVGQGVTENLTLTLTAGVAPNTHSTSLDAIGHEIAHGIDAKYLGLKNLNDFSEGNIILEGFCDILGIAVESTKKVNNDWQIGNDFYPNEIRYMNNPNNSIFNGVVKPQPKMYNGTHWMNQAQAQAQSQALGFSGNGSNLYMHHNNGIMNYWFYLLVEGGSGTNDNGLAYNISPINTNTNNNQSSNALENAIYVVFETFTEEFGKNDYTIKDFQNLRKATMNVAFEKYGCNVWNTVRQAWDAVGVTGGTCEIAVNITTTCPSPSTCTANITTCGGSATGTRIKISGGGLTAPIKISATQHNETSLVCGNTYTVEVTDKNNPDECVIIKNFTCQASTTGSINLPSPCPPNLDIQIGSNIINDCNDENDLTPLLPEGTYTYNWSNGSTTQNLTNVPSGTYSLTFTDVSNGCSYQERFNVTGLVPLNVSGQIIHSACNSMPPPPHHPLTTNDGSSINITVSGGLSPYTYSWSNGVTTQNVSNLRPNGYTVTVTDGNGCTKVQTFSIGAPEPNLLNVSIFNACPIANDGEIINVTIGGTPPYSYQWSGPGNSQTVESPIDVASGTHYVTVTDANGCTDIATRFVAPAPSTWVYDYDNCEKVYTCHGQQIIEDMLDYGNIINVNNEDCTGEIVCLIPGGTTEPISGNTSYYVDLGFRSDFPHCEIDCYINDVYQGSGGNMPSTLSSYMLPSTTVNVFCDGNYYDVYCDGQFTGYYCDEEDIVVTILIGIYPGWEPDTPLPTDTIHLTGPMARVTNGGNLSGLEDDEISIFPNPFDDYINLTFESNFEIVNIKLLNIMGQEVESKILHINKGTQNIRMDFEQELAHGIYLIQLEFPDGSIYTQKLIKQ